MMKNVKNIFGKVLIVAAFCMMIGSVIASVIFQFQNPDMTDIRCLIENPGPSIVAVLSFIFFGIGKMLMDN